MWSDLENHMTNLIGMQGEFKNWLSFGLECEFDLN